MKKLLLMAPVMLLPFTGSAADAADRSELGAEVRAWTELQKSGNASLGAIRPMPGEIADRVYERYLQSFTRPIPEQYGRESFVGGSSGGGSGGK